MIDKLIFVCLLCTSELMEFMEISVSQGASQGRSFLARAFDLTRPGVAPPLPLSIPRSVSPGRTCSGTCGQGLQQPTNMQPGTFCYR